MLLHFYRLARPWFGRSRPFRQHVQHVLKHHVTGAQQHQQVEQAAVALQQINASAQEVAGSSAQAADAARGIKGSVAVKALAPELAQLPEGFPLALAAEILPTLERLRIWLDTHR